MSVITWKSEWEDDLIWCPSQLTRRLEVEGREYELYCRWRWSDPWTFQLICQPHNNGIDDWIYLDTFVESEPGRDDFIGTVHGVAEAAAARYFRDDPIRAPKTEEELDAERNSKVKKLISMYDAMKRRDAKWHERNKPTDTISDTNAPVPQIDDPAED